MKHATLVTMIICLCAFAGCFMWSTDTKTGNEVTPDEASRMKSGPTLIIPSAAGTYTYRSYQPGQNHCAEDLQKMLDDRARNGANGPVPYCGEMNVGPVQVHGSEGVIL
ncbi:MAG TPA: hypothetical protein VN867_04985 [Candidatus Binataceae bacterium]|nr:hypothetical protein [Candidatus Binataceae bacterium]